MTIFISTRPDRIHLVAPVALLLACAPDIALLAQGLDAEGAIETIVGSQVETAEEAIATDEKRIIAAIENSSANAAEVRKRFTVDNVRIVFLPDLEEKGAAVKAKIEEAGSGIAALREAIQGSAIFYHAIDSRSVLLDDIIAVEFGEKNDVTILVAGREP
ncbi:MAG: hypothetical protein DCC69_03605 [Hyphomicrobiales bacterium]|nr:MAG: hypothetical protein DCC69_03605 [Hyphomicrobiales bacterium]